MLVFLPWFVVCVFLSQPVLSFVPGHVNRQRKVTPYKETSSLKVSTNNRQPPANRNRRRNDAGPRSDSSSSYSNFKDINQAIVKSESAHEVLSIFGSTPTIFTKTAGGGALNNVNFSTGIHRIARHVSRNRQDRAAVLTDPKFALFLCSLAESLAGADYSKPLSSLVTIATDTNEHKNKYHYGDRELTNVAWAFAKLRIVPPSSELPMQVASVSRENLVQASLQLRKDIISSKQENTRNWISSLSMLSAKFLDFVAYEALARHDSPSSVKFKGGYQDKFKGSGYQEKVNLLYAFAMVKRVDNEVFDSLTSSLALLITKSSTSPRPSEFSIPIWALATAGYEGKHQQRLFELILEALDKDKFYINAFKTQELSNVAWGMSTILGLRREAGDANDGSKEQEDQDLVVVKILRYITKAMAERISEYNSQEVANSVWALGTLGFGIGKAGAAARNVNDYIILKSDDYDLDEKLVDQVMEAVNNNVPSRLGSFKTQELNNLPYGCARLNRCLPELFSSIAREFPIRRQRFTGQDVGATLWSFATVGYFDEESFRNVLSRVKFDGMRHYKPQEVSNVLWALGTAGIKPRFPETFDHSFVPAAERTSYDEFKTDEITLTLAISSQEFLRRIDAFKVQELKDVLWGFSKVETRHPKMFRETAEYLVGTADDVVPPGQLHAGVGFEGFKSQVLSNTLYAYTRQAQLASNSSPEMHGRLGACLGSAIDIGENVLKRLINCAAETAVTVYGDMSGWTNADLANGIWSMSALNYRHTPFCRAVEKHLVNRLRNFLSGGGDHYSLRGQELSNIVWSLATVDALRPDVIDVVSDYLDVQYRGGNGDHSAESIAKYHNRQELGNILWSCCVANRYPPSLINHLKRGLIGEGSEQTPSFMAKCHDDEGLQESDVINLLYAQSSMQLDGQNEPLILPNNFPNGWGSFNQFDNDAGFVQRLSTSKIQSHVSAAFQRIGFNHVEEHIVNGNDNGALLSLDIADPERKIGIEVDGPSHYYHLLDEWKPQDPCNSFAKIRNGNLRYQFSWNRKINKENGSTMLKGRMLSQLGWTVIHVPFFEWDKHQSKESQNAYCEELLERNSVATTDSPL